MVIPIHCVDCGKLIGEIDTAKTKKFTALDAPCGERVCKECCEKCKKEAEAHGDVCRKVS